MPSVRVNIMDRVIPDFYAACMASGLYARALSKRSENSFMASPGTRPRSRYALKHISFPPWHCRAAALTRHRSPKAVAFYFEPHGPPRPREAPSVLQAARDCGLHLPAAEYRGEWLSLRDLFCPLVFLPPRPGHRPGRMAEFRYRVRAAVVEPDARLDSGPLLLRAVHGFSSTIRGPGFPLRSLSFASA